jgi:hypothetical protein
LAAAADADSRWRLARSIFDSSIFSSCMIEEEGH